MKITKEINTAWEIRNNAWAGAIQTLDLLTDDEIENLVEGLEEIYPDGMTETEFNDFLWFDTEFIAEFFGYDNFEEMYTERTKEA